MPVLIEAISIGIRAEVVNKLYPGGWDGFRDDCPNKTLCADNELIRVGFMNPTDAQQGDKMRERTPRNNTAMIVVAWMVIAASLLGCSAFADGVDGRVIKLLYICVY